MVILDTTSGMNRAPSANLFLAGLSYIPQDDDVVCGRSSISSIHNEKFRSVVERYTAEYRRAVVRSSKTEVIDRLVKEIMGKGGLFIQKDSYTGLWYIVTEKIAHEKAGQAIRSAIRKSNKAKTIKAETGIKPKKKKTPGRSPSAKNLEPANHARNPPGGGSIATTVASASSGGAGNDKTELLSAAASPPPPPPPIFRSFSSSWTIPDNIEMDQMGLAHFSFALESTL